MALVNAKCTNCGGALQVDDDKEAAICPFCDSAFIVEKAVQNFNIINNKRGRRSYPRQSAERLRH